MTRSYKVVRQIGRGGFGVVEEVQSDDGLQLARKTFSPNEGIPKSSYEIFVKNLVERF